MEEEEEEEGGEGRGGKGRGRRRREGTERRERRRRRRRGREGRAYLYSFSLQTCLAVCTSFKLTCFLSATLYRLCHAEKHFCRTALAECLSALSTLSFLTRAQLVSSLQDMNTLYTLAEGREEERGRGGEGEGKGRGKRGRGRKGDEDEIGERENIH